MIDPASATSEASWWIAAPASRAYQATQKAPAVGAGIDHSADIGAVVRDDVVPRSPGLRRNRSWPRWRVAASAARWLAQRPLPSESLSHAIFRRPAPHLRGVAGDLALRRNVMMPVKKGARRRLPGPDIGVRDDELATSDQFEIMSSAPELHAVRTPHSDSSRTARPQVGLHNRERCGCEPARDQDRLGSTGIESGGGRRDETRKDEVVVGHGGQPRQALQGGG